jgi:hypothetical protein
MVGLRLFHDAAMLSEQPGLDAIELRRAAAARRSCAPGASPDGGRMDAPLGLGLTETPTLLEYPYSD